MKENNNCIKDFDLTGLSLTEWDSILSYTRQRLDETYKEKVAKKQSVSKHFEDDLKRQLGICI